MAIASRVAASSSDLRHANPTLVGGSDDEEAGINRCRQERPYPWGPDSPGSTYEHIQRESQ
jgi:hypothetical protein